MIETINLKLQKAELNESYSLSQHNDNLDKIDKIIESGSNSNGRYVKFDDGTLICYRYLGTITMTVSSNDTAHVEYSFPHNFIDSPSISISGEPTSRTGSVRLAWINSAALSGSQIRIRVLNVDPTIVEEVRRASYIAIGRWK